MAAVHLHRDYSNSHCGLDISYLPATFDEAAATCRACAKGLADFRSEQERERIALQQERDAELAREAEKAANRKAAAELLKAKAEKEAAEQAQRDAEQIHEWLPAQLR